MEPWISRLLKSLYFLPQKCCYPHLAPVNPLCHPGSGEERSGAEWRGLGGGGGGGCWVIERCEFDGMCVQSPAGTATANSADWGGVGAG